MEIGGAVVRAVPTKGYRPVVKIIPWVKHIGTKEKLRICSFFFLLFFFFLWKVTGSLGSELQKMKIWATFQNILGNCSLPFISFKPSSSLILSNWKFFFLGKKKCLMQAGLKALSLFGHPMGLSKLPCDEFIVLHLDGPYGLHSSKSKQSLTRW